MTIGVAIPTRNRPRELARLLATLEWQELRPREVIVVDDSDLRWHEDVERITSQSSLDIRLHRKPTPGLPASRNLAADLSTSDVLLYLDDDTILHPSYLRELQRQFNDERVGGAGGVIQDESAPRGRAFGALCGLPGSSSGRVYTSGWGAGMPRKSRQTDYLSGCNMAFRSEVLDAFRFNEERYWGYGLGEDLEFSCAVRSAGWELRVTEDARLWHLSSPPSASGWDWGYQEVVIRPSIAAGSFSKIRFVVAATCLACSNRFHSPERARGNWAGVKDVLRGRINVQRLDKGE